MVRLYLLANASLGCLAIASQAAAQSSTETYSYDELGRLVSVKTVGGQSHNDTHSVYYDAAGNRSQYKTTANGAAASSVDVGVVGGSPTPPPPPGNIPRASTSDTALGNCFNPTTANDRDREGHLPLALTAIVKNNGSATASMVPGVSSNFTYAVADSSGTKATDVPGISALNCGSSGSLE